MKKRLLSLSLVVCLCFAFAVNSLALTVPDDVANIDINKDMHIRLFLDSSNPGYSKQVEFLNNFKLCSFRSVTCNYFEGEFLLRLVYYCKSENDLSFYNQPSYSYILGETNGLKTLCVDSNSSGKFVQMHFRYDSNSNCFTTGSVSSIFFGSNARVVLEENNKIGYLGGTLFDFCSESRVPIIQEYGKIDNDYSGMFLEDNLGILGDYTDFDPPSSSEEPPPVIEPPPIVQPPPVAPPDIPKGDGVYVTYDTSVWQGFLDYCLNAIGQSSAIAFKIFALLTGFWLVVWVIKTLTK